MDYMYKTNDLGSPHTADASPEIDGTPIAGVYRGWGPTGGQGALRVVNGSDRLSAHGTESAPSELESPLSPPLRAGFRSPQPAMRELPVELAGGGGGGGEGKG